MRSQMTITRPSDAWGDHGQRTYHGESSVTLEERNGSLALIVTQGAVSHSPGYESPHTPAAPEIVARITLYADERRTLAAFLSSLPNEEA